MERYFTILHYMRYLGRQMTHLPHFHLPTSLICSLPCWLKDCSNGQESENEETRFQEAEMITREFLRPSKKSFIIVKI